MEKTFKIKDLAYSEKEVRKISINDLTVGKICAGYIVHFFRSRPNPVIFVHAGDPITKETIERLEKKKLQTLNICEAYDRATKDRLTSLLNELKEMKFEEERVFHAQEIIKEVLEICFYETDGNLLDVILSFHEVFYSFPQDLTESFFKNSTEDYVRCTELAFFSSFMCLVMGYYDFEFMQDIYHMSFLLDISLNNNLSFELNHARDLERSRSQAGVEYLSFRSKNELNKFKSHPEKSYKLAKSLGNIFHIRSLHENILNQHEWGDGTGFFSKGQKDFFDWEVIIAFSDIFIGKRTTHFHKGDANKKYGLRLRDLRLERNSRKKYFIRFLDRLEKYYRTFDKTEEEQTA